MGRRSTLLSYRTALIVAAVLHVLLFLGLSLQWPSPTSLFPPTVAPKIIEAVAVPSQNLQKEVERLQSQEQLHHEQLIQEEARASAQQQAAKVRAEQLQIQEQQATQQRLQEQKKLEVLKLEQQRLQEAQKQQALALEATRKQRLLEEQKIQEVQRLKAEQLQLEQQKAAVLAQQKMKAIVALKAQALEKQKRAEAVKQKAAETAKQKTAEAAKLKAAEAVKQKALVLAQQKAQLLAQQRTTQKTLQQKLFEQQLAAEQQQISVAQAQAVDNIVNQYKSQILSAIGQRWIVPAGTNKNSAAQLFITLAPGGAVLNVVVVQSSGDPFLDRSAITAVYKASPLPVPKAAELFDHFRELHLTVRPEEIVSG